MSINSNKKRLRDKITAADSVVCELADQWARERARICYTLEIEQFDIEKQEQRLDGETLNLYFVFPLHERGAETQTLAKAPFLVKGFKRGRAHAFHMRVGIEIEIDGKPLMHTSVTRTTSELAKWDARIFHIHNMNDPNYDQLGQGWLVQLGFHDDGVLKSVVFNHDPSRCEGLVAFMHRQAVMAQEDRIMRMSNLVGKVDNEGKKRRAGAE